MAELVGGFCCVKAGDSAREGGKEGGTKKAGPGNLGQPQPESTSFS